MDKTGAISLSLSIFSSSDYALVNVNADNQKAAASLKESDVWKNIPAVKAGHVLDVDYNIFYFADPMSLDLQLDAFKEAV